MTRAYILTSTSPFISDLAALINPSGSACVVATRPGGSIAAAATTRNVFSSASWTAWVEGSDYARMTPDENITYTEDGLMTILAGGTFSLNAFLVGIADTSSTPSNISIRKNGVAIWRTAMLINASVDPAPVSFNVILTGSANDKFGIFWQPGQGAGATYTFISGSTFSMQRIK